MAKLIDYDAVRDDLLADPEVRAAYEREERRERLAATLEGWKKAAGLNTSQIAERLGVDRSVVSKLEKDATRSGIDTFARYAAACGIKNPVIHL